MGERMDVINVDLETATARSTHTEFSLAVALPRLHQRQIVLQGFRMLNRLALVTLYFDICIHDPQIPADGHRDRVSDRFGKPSILPYFDLECARGLQRRHHV